MCEPLNLDLQTGLVGAGAVERAERRGLVRVVAKLEVRFYPPVVWRGDPRPAGGEFPETTRSQLVS